MPSGHWTNDSDIGGGRIIGEGCHFIDLAMYLASSPIRTVYASGFSESASLIDTASIILTFENGSIATIIYLANGNKNLPKEYLEVFCNGTVAILEDFRKLALLGKRKTIIKGKQDKGHKEELIKFVEAIKRVNPHLLQLKRFIR